MRDEVVAVRYSEAIFNLASVQKNVRAVAGELNGILQVVRKTPAFTVYLEHPKIPREDKIGLLKKVFSGRILPLTRDFLLLLMRKNRWAYFPGIVREYRSLVDKSEGREKARLATAVPVTREIEEEVKTKLAALTGKKMELTTVVNPALIGGAAVYLPGAVIDGSLQAGLKALKEKLSVVRVH